jgi:hypothetical protein
MKINIDLYIISINMILDSYRENGCDLLELDENGKFLCNAHIVECRQQAVGTYCPFKVRMKNIVWGIQC